jgi:hypothetical protein
MIKRHLHNFWALTLLVSLFLATPAVFAQQVETIKGSTVMKATFLGVAGIGAEAPGEDWQGSLRNTSIIHTPGVDTDVDLFLKTKADADKRYAESLNSTGEAYKTNAVNAPVLSHNWEGNPYANSIPNDNHIAISNAGIVVSVINTNIRAYRDTNLTNNPPIWSRTLQSFIGALLPGNSDIKYDPRVIYDPKADRFIIVYLVGATDATSQIPVAFSKTNNPTEGWNIYLISGNPNQDGTWTDYPQIGITDEELFITGNSFTNAGSFRYTLIWQMDKVAGYTGDSNVNFKVFQMPTGVFTACPAIYGATTQGPRMYFVSGISRPAQPSGSIRLHVLDNTIANGGQIVSATYTAATQYRVAASANQPGNQARRLNTNDCRVQSAFIQDDELHFVLNSGNASSKPSIYHGIFRNLNSTPQLTAKIITHPTLEVAFPGIVYTGAHFGDYSSVISVLHSSSTERPGTSAVFVNDLNEASDFITIKQGLGVMNTGIDGNAQTERWGDYIGAAKKFSETNTVIIGGSYGTTSNDPGTWIAKVFAPNVFGVNTEPLQQNVQDVNMYPNPAKQDVFVQYNVPVNSTRYLSARIYNMQGLLMKEVINSRVKAGNAKLMFSTEFLPKGMYIVRLEDGNQTIWQDKLIVE